ncbi:MAG: lipoprotein-releasing ABC transporter permease subunit [Robiginitomaculum sp.]
MSALGDTPKGAHAFGKFERKLARRYLGARKSEGGVGLIAFLAFTCIALAIAAMIIIMSIMNGFRETTVAMTLGLDGHMYVGSSQADPAPERMEELRKRMIAIDGVKLVFPYVETQTFIQGGGKNAGAKVTGITPQDLQNIKIVSDNIIAGSLQTFGQGHNGGNNIAIGYHLADYLGLTIGDKVTIYSPIPKQTAFGVRPLYKAYNVVAMFKTGLFVADSGNIYMPLNQASLFFEKGRAPMSLQLRLKNADLIHKLKPIVYEKADEPIFLYTWEDKNAGMATALKTEQIAMRFIFMIVVIIAVFPVLASMIMLVKNKGKDIAILRTIGATSGSVLRVFLMSGAAIGVLGTLVGIIFGIVFCLNIDVVQAIIEKITGSKIFDPEIYGIDKLPVKIVPMEVFWVSLWGFMISALATFFPALTASKVDPVEALRYE